MGASLLRNKCFFGVEVEGRFRGFPTLFIPGDALPDVPTVRLLLEVDAVCHIYLGAHREPILWSDPACRELVVEYLTAFPSCVFTIEHPIEYQAHHIPYEILVHSRVRMLWRLRTLASIFLTPSCEFKVDGAENAVIFTPQQFIDTRYAQDRTVVVRE